MNKADKAVKRRWRMIEIDGFGEVADTVDLNKLLADCIT